MNKIIIIFWIALFPSVLLGACGSAAGPSKSLDVTMTDFMFSPNSFTVPAGAQISFQATNNGAVAHSFIIMKEGYQITSHFTDADKPNIYWKVDQIAPGQSIKDSFMAPDDPGNYQIICGISGHYEAGMVAKLIVVKGQ